MGAKDAELGHSTDDQGGSETRGVTSSRIVPTGDSGVDSARAKRSSFRALTPYQARLDVEMDDTAVSKVRDPSVSLRLSREDVLPTSDERARTRGPLASLALGITGGVLVVLLLAFFVRACGR